jgi:hypothetical protein
MPESNILNLESHETQNDEVLCTQNPLYGQQSQEKATSP